MIETDTIRAFLEPRHLALAGELARFAETRLAAFPPAEDDAAARARAPDIVRALGEAGLCALAFPPACGGSEHGPDFRAGCLVREALAAASPLADALYALEWLGALPLLLAGDPAQKGRFLPRVARGLAIPAFAMTEPEAGSDVAAIRTTARREGEGYVLDGMKTLISNAGIADFYCVFASTDPARGGKGLSCFVVEAQTPGLRFVRPQVLSEPHPLGEIALEACRVPLAARLGAEGDGMKIGLATLDRMRATVGAAACGMAARALAEATARARTRRQFGRPIGDFQLVRERLARSAVRLAAARLLVYRAAWEKDHGKERLTLESAMAKAFATEAAQEVIDDALQISGGAGCLAGHPVERLYSAVRALRIYEGTTEIQHLVIAEHMLRADPGAPPSA
jgi:acyl-CoA dehydrogenase